MAHTNTDPPFFQLTRDRLLFLRQHLKLNNSCYVYFALQLDHPQRIRGEFRIDLKRFQLAWGIPRSSLYSAIAQLEALKVIKTTSVELFVRWNNPTTEELSRISDRNLESETKISNPRQKSDISDKQRLEPATSTASEALQINTDHLKEREKEEDFATQEGNTDDFLTEEDKTPELPDRSSGQEVSAFHPTNLVLSSGGDSDSAFKTYVSFERFEFENFAWESFNQPGDGGSDPEFFAYTCDRVRERSASYQKQGKPPIDSIYTYAVECIRRSGAKRYRTWLQKIGKLPPDPAPLPAATTATAATSNRPPEPNPYQNGSGREFVAPPPVDDHQPATPENIFQFRRSLLEGLFARDRVEQMIRHLNCWLQNGYEHEVDHLLTIFPHWDLIRRHTCVVRAAEVAEGEEGDDYASA